MRVSEVKLKQESEGELFFAHYPMGGLIFALLGLSFGYFPIYLGADTFTRWVFGGAGILFAIIGTLGAFWRYDLRLDLVSRVYTRRRGMWPFPKTTLGSLDDLKSVILTQEWSRARSSRGHSTTHPWWKISLEFSGWDKPVGIEALDSELEGHARLEYYAKKLKSWAVDRTGEQEIKRHWEQLDQPLMEETAPKSLPETGQRVDPRSPPPGSMIRVQEKGGGLQILLPAAGMSPALVFVAFIGIVFTVFGAFFILVQSGLYKEITGNNVTFAASSVAAGWLIAWFFVLCGMAILFFALALSYGREHLTEDAGRIIYEYRFSGWVLRSQNYFKNEIEHIDQRRDISPLGIHSPSHGTRAMEILIRSDKGVVRFGKQLDETDRRWLLAVLTLMVRSHG